MKSNPKANSAAKARPAPVPQHEQAAAVQALAAAVPHNTGKAKEFGRDNAVAPSRGVSTVSDSPTASASTLSEVNASPKAQALDPARSTASGQALTTNQGVAIGDNQNSLKAGLRGPTLLEDFILREKITHFDHERIPERIVHARGSAAHGYFEAYEPLTEFTRAAPFAGGRQDHAGVRALLHRGRRARLDRHRARRARLCRQVLHRRRQLGPGRQQHPGVLHPGRDEVPRPDPRRQARAAPRHAAGRHRRTTPSGTSSR